MFFLACCQRSSIRKVGHLIGDTFRIELYYLKQKSVQINTERPIFFIHCWQPLLSIKGYFH
jgi:hypothetical protein